MEGWRQALALVMVGGVAAFLTGAYLYAKKLSRLGGLLMGLALLGVVVGVGAIVVPAVHDAERLPLTGGDFPDACEARHFFSDDAAVCRCAVGAYRETRAVYPGLRHRRAGHELVIDGPRAGVVMFHERFAECAAPRVRGWIEAHCRADCDPAFAGCSWRCQCVARRLTDERSDSRIAYMFFPEPGPAPADSLGGAITAARERCRDSVPADDPSDLEHVLEPE